MPELTDRERLEAERSATAERLGMLEAAFSELVAASRDTNADDEHDPEGSTIAFERAQLAAVRDQAREHLAEVDSALGRLAAGTYGGCERCRLPIPPGRLEARPAARRCLECASLP